MNVLKHAVGRIFWALAVVFAVASASFFLLNALPGDPARVVAGPQARPEDLARVREELQLDQPIVIRYGLFLRTLGHVANPKADAERGQVEKERELKSGLEKPKRAAHATCQRVASLAGGYEFHVDFGRSYQHRAPVAKVIFERYPRSLALAIAGIFLQLVIGVTLGAIAAAKKGTWIDRFVTSLTSLAVSAPTFLTAVLLQYLFAHRFRLLPLDGFGDTFAGHIRSIALPALTLGLYGAAYFARLTRDELITLMSQDFVRTARAKGASRLRAFVVHGLRGALLPLATAAGLELGALASGAAVTESIFRWPGLGHLGVEAVLNRDGPMVIGVVFVAASSVVIATAAIDIFGYWLHPLARAKSSN